MTETVELAASFEEAERLRPLWERVAWEREEAEWELFCARAAAREGVVAPLAAFVLRDGAPVAALAARVEERRLPASVGYRVLYAPQVRLAQLVDGGMVAADAAALDALLRELRGAIGRLRLDAVAAPPLPVGSAPARALASLGVTQPFVTPWRRRRLVLPESFDAFLASRSANTRWRIRRDARRLQQAFGAELESVVLRAPSDFERIVADADLVAAKTYQRALGAGFVGSEEQRAVVRVGLERGWIRAYLLSLAGAPISYWLCSLYRGTLLVRWTGYDDAFADHRVGYHLLARLVESACADPEIAVLDFGPGDAAYKLQFSNESELERNVLVYAPSVRALRVAAGRTAIAGGALLARRSLDALGATDRLRTGWRGRLRRSAGS